MEIYGGTALQQRILRGAAAKLEAEGYRNIKVDHIPWEGGRPAERNNTVPDIEGERFGNYRLVEVQTEDTYLDDREHVAALAEYADMHANIEFYLACPSEFQDKLRDSYEIDFSIVPDGYYTV